MAGDAETPDNLTVSLDREQYAAGDVAAVRIEPNGAGEALVTVLGNGVLWHRHVSVPAAGATVEIPVDGGWAPPGPSASTERT